MSRLIIDCCHVNLNTGVSGAEALEGELHKIFPQREHEGHCDLEFSYDLNVETLYINMNYDRPNCGPEENLMMVCVDGLENVDALRRYCEMVLDHHAKAKEIK